MNKWLDDTPKFSENSSASSSPRAGVHVANRGSSKQTDEEFENLAGNVEEEHCKQNRSSCSPPRPVSTSKKLKNKTMQHKKKGLLILASKGRLPASDTTKEDRDSVKKKKKGTN